MLRASIIVAHLNAQVADAPRSVFDLLLVAVLSCRWRPATTRSRATYAKILIVEGRVEQQEEAAVRLMSPHGVVGEHHDVAFAYGYVNHGGFVGEFSAACEHAADEQGFFI